MITIEDLDSEIEHGSSRLHLPEEQPPEEQPPEEQPPEEVQEASPLPLLNHAQYSGRIFCGCSLFGCNHVVEGSEESYCCMNHQKMAEFLSSQEQAYVIIDGFFDNDNKEKNLKIVLALLKKVDHGLALGIPEIKDDTFFLRHPRQLSFIDLEFLTEETSRAWLFFHSKSNPVFKKFLWEDRKIRWSRSHQFVHKYGNFEEIKSKLSYLRIDYEKNDVRVEGDSLGLKGWILTEHIYKGTSLFCLSFSSEKNSSIFSTIKVKKRNSSGPGESSRSKKTKKSDAQNDVKMLQRELKALYVKAHMYVTEEVMKLIDPGVSDSAPPSISILEDHLNIAKHEASSREAIISDIDKLMHVKKEEQWLSEYAKRGDLYNILVNDQKSIERATNARRFVSEIPSMIVNLIDRVKTWETEQGVSFLYDKHLLLQLLNEENQKL